MWLAAKSCQTYKCSISAPVLMKTRSYTQNKGTNVCV